MEVNNKSFSIFRLPYAKEINYIKGDLVKCLSDLPKDNFVVSDFEGNRYCFENHQLEQFSEENFANELNIDFCNLDIPLESKMIATSEQEFINNVEKGKEAIAEGKVSKVVFSKVKIQKNYIADYKKIFLNLCLAYPETFVCMFYDAQLGFWIGASPELLLESTQADIHTVALAGTQQSMGKSTRDAAWSQKEIEEQALVCRYIINCFKKIRLREYQETGPKTIQTGNLFHLKTDFTIHKIDTDIKDLENQLLELLHPTSAVCGMPKLEAKELLQNTESYKRNLYTGFWGSTCKEGFNFYVNIRLAQVFKNQVVYYAGAGITEGSNPRLEWAETEAKCDNLALKMMN